MVFAKMTPTFMVQNHCIQKQCVLLKCDLRSVSVPDSLGRLVHNVPGQVANVIAKTSNSLVNDKG